MSAKWSYSAIVSDCCHYRFGFGVLKKEVFLSQCTCIYRHHSIAGTETDPSEIAHWLSEAQKLTAEASAERDSVENVGGTYARPNE